MIHIIIYIIIYVIQKNVNRHKRLDRKLKMILFTNQSIGRSGWKIWSASSRGRPRSSVCTVLPRVWSPRGCRCSFPGRTEFRTGSPGLIPARDSTLWTGFPPRCSRREETEPGSAQSIPDSRSEPTQRISSCLEYLLQFLRVSLRCHGSLLTTNTPDHCVFKDYMQIYAVIPHITRSFPPLWIYTLLRQDYWGRPVAVTWLAGAVCCSNARKSPEEMLLNQWTQLFYIRFISSHSRDDVYGVPSDDVWADITAWSWERCLWRTHMIQFHSAFVGKKKRMQWFKKRFGHLNVLFLYFSVHFSLVVMCACFFISSCSIST